ncbi:hypothetical protein THOM_2110 [Trachipleistophora hominis]|uniref:Uncharacterized protein n=1 Tax=Trachipleistophora hominis TaxID=72359 RepID=L7JTY4_TRAHO|nr:hypothetical protein THOM_2110 [Trachipleistophora hominis]
MISVLLYFWMSYASYQDVMAPGLPCTIDNRTYNVDWKIHVQKSIVEAIHSVALSNIVAHETEREAIAGYFGTIFDELNQELLPFKVQFHLKLDGYNTDQTMGALSLDPSCEKSDAVSERTSAALTYLNQSFAGNVGLHLFVWGCNFIPPGSSISAFYSSLRCGRVAGIMWRGMKESRENVKNAIVNAIAGFIATDQGPVIDGAKLCAYMQQCVGMQGSEIGQLVEGTVPVFYTDSDSGALPDEKEALMAYNEVAH